jgi:hypothetical protein
MRKRGLSAARELPIVSLRQGGQPAVRETGMWAPHEARPPRLVRRLSRTRHPHGYDAERRGCDGRRSSPHRRKRDMPPTANIRTPCRGRDNEVGAPDHPSKQSRPHQRGPSVRAPKEHFGVRKRCVFCLPPLRTSSAYRMGGAQARLQSRRLSCRSPHSSNTTSTP